MGPIVFLTLQITFIITSMKNIITSAFQWQLSGSDSGFADPGGHRLRPGLGGRLAHHRAEGQADLRAAEATRGRRRNERPQQSRNLVRSRNSHPAEPAGPRRGDGGEGPGCHSG